MRTEKIMIINKNKNNNNKNKQKRGKTINGNYYFCTLQ